MADVIQFPISRLDRRIALKRYALEHGIDPDALKTLKTPEIATWTRLNVARSKSEPRTKVNTSEPVSPFNS